MLMLILQKFRQFTRKIDKTFLNGFFASYQYARKTLKASKILKKNNNLQINIFYSKNYQSTLTQLCDMYGTDKGEIRPERHTHLFRFFRYHNYTDFYELLFEPRRNDVKHVLECGIGYKVAYSEMLKSGASLRVWRDYFPYAKIIGLDIDDQLLFSEERIETFCVDQTSQDSIKKFLDNIDDRDFDIVIDDGLHEFHAGKTLFEGMKDKLAKDGIYIIEDVDLSNLKLYSDYFAGLKDEFYVRFVNLHRPPTPLGDNSLIVITRKKVS